jgi:hypothetical protein
MAKQLTEQELRRQAIQALSDLLVQWRPCVFTR